MKLRLGEKNVDSEEEGFELGVFLGPFCYCNCLEKLMDVSDGASCKFAKSPSCYIILPLV